MPGRISTTQLFQNAQGNVSAAREKEVLSSEKASTGKDFIRPSENPSGFILGNHLKDELSMKESIAKNVSLANNVMAMHETIFTQVQELVQRGHELAVSMAGDANTAEYQRKNSLKEVENLFDGAVTALNTRYSNRSLMAGTLTDKAAFNSQGIFQGNNEVMEIELAPGSRIPINITTAHAILGQGVENGVNILEVLSRLATGVRVNNTEMIRSTLEDLQKANDQMSLMRGEVGARMEQIRHALEEHEEGKINSTEEISKIEDADAVKTFSDLSRDQTVLRAAISTSEKILTDNPTVILYK